MSGEKDLEQLKKEAAAKAKAEALSKLKGDAPAAENDDVAKQKADAAAKAKAAAAAKAKAAAAAKAKAAAAAKTEETEGAEQAAGTDAASEKAKAAAAAKAKAAAAAKAKAAAAAKAKAAAAAKAKAQAGAGGDADSEKAKAIAAAKAKAAAAAAKAKAAGGANASEAAEEKKPSPNQPYLDKYIKVIEDHLGKDCLEDSYINELSKDVPTLVVKKESYYKTAEFLKYNEQLGFDYLSELHGTDFQTHMEIYVHLYSYKNNQSVALKVKIDRDQPVIDSLVPLWPGANWPECEAYDLLGIQFNGHPNLHRIMLGEDWVGYPLRKDYDVEV